MTRKTNTLNEIIHYGDCMGYSDRKYWKYLIQQELMKWYHRSDGNKHKFILDFLEMTEEEIEKELTE